MAGYTKQEFFQNFRMPRNTFHHILFLAPACGALYFLFSMNFICHSFTKPCSAGQNDIKFALNATWLFRLRSHSKKSDSLRIRFSTTYGLILNQKCQIQCDLCCSHCQKQIRYGSNMNISDLQFLCWPGSVPFVGVSLCMLRHLLEQNCNSRGER